MIITRGPVEKCDYKKVYAEFTDIKNVDRDLKYDTEKSLMESIIPSKDVRKYHKNIGFNYTDFAIASLISHSGMPFFRKIKEFENIIRNSSDKSLIDQIGHYTEYMKYSYKAFIDNQILDCLFKVVATDREDDEYYCFFANYEDARKYSSKLLGENFTIYKMRLLKEVPEPEDDLLYFNNYGLASYDEKGDLITCYMNEIQSPADVNEAFYKSYVYIPFPFRSGDIVTDLSTGELGIVTGPENDEKYREMYEKLFNNDKNYDYSDYMINIESIREQDDEFYWGYDHCSPLDLEIATNDFDNPEFGSIEMILSRMKRIKNGDGMFFDLEYAIKEYRKKRNNK